MPIDYAIGVGTFVPNNAVIMHGDVVKLMSDLMKQARIKHTTSECTLRGFTCALANVDPKTATPAEIAKIRKIQTGYQVDGITGGLTVKAQAKPESKAKPQPEPEPVSLAAVGETFIWPVCLCPFLSADC